MKSTKEIISRIDDIRKSCESHGWLDGHGVAVSDSSASILSAFFASLCLLREGFPGGIYPTPDGEIQLEVSDNIYSLNLKTVTFNGGDQGFILSRSMVHIETEEPSLFFMADETEAASKVFDAYLKLLVNPE